jgi:hypothetical protein
MAKRDISSSGPARTGTEELPAPLMQRGRPSCLKPETGIEPVSGFSLPHERLGFAQSSHFDVVKGPPQGRAVSPKMLAHFGSPTRRAAGAWRPLTRPSPPPADVIFLKHMEMTTMTIEQHIEELLAEFKNAVGAGERRQIETELELARAEREVLLAEQDGRVSAVPPF